ncbi:MAG: hypothetical protein PVF87_07135 [Acidimicrobiia bacterium]
MNPHHDQLAVLRRLRREGQISDEEYHNLAGSYAEPSPAASGDLDERDIGVDEPGVDDGVGTDLAGEDEPVSDEGSEGPRPLQPPSLRKNLSRSYLISLLAAAVVLLLVSSIGMISWWVSLPTVMVLATTLFEGWGKVTTAGALVVAAIMIVGVLSSLGGSTQTAPVVEATLPPQDPNPAIPGSLGIYMDQVTELWNTVDAPPRITRGLTRHNEVGAYDTFIYRFGDWGSVAGAFDPDTEAVYALLLTGSFDEPATEQLYVHACFMVAPYSQECIESYHEQGLDENALADFADTTHEAEWGLGENTWRVEIGQNLLAIRIYAPDAA